jgi:two-component system alkaline phosphatase synthesis response regulator PhoP
MATSVDPKVLIVDDDHALADLLVIVLSMDGFRAEAAYSGKQALESVAKEKPAAMVLDVMMPDIDGFAVLASLRGDPATASVPVVMLSARVDEETRERCLEAGANSYLTKPAEPQELTAELRSQIARPPGGGPA